MRETIINNASNEWFPPRNIKMLTGKTGQTPLRCAARAMSESWPRLYRQDSLDAKHTLASEEHGELV